MPSPCLSVHLGLAWKDSYDQEEDQSHLAHPPRTPLLITTPTNISTAHSTKAGFLASPAALPQQKYLSWAKIWRPRFLKKLSTLLQPTVVVRKVLGINPAPILAKHLKTILVTQAKASLTMALEARATRDIHQPANNPSATTNNQASLYWQNPADASRMQRLAVQRNPSTKPSTRSFMALLANTQAAAQLQNISYRCSQRGADTDAHELLQGVFPTSPKRKITPSAILSPWTKCALAFQSVLMLLLALTNAKRNGKNFHIAWLDLANAFPSVAHIVLLNTLQHLGLPPAIIINLVEAFYIGTEDNRTQPVGCIGFQGRLCSRLQSRKRKAYSFFSVQSQRKAGWMYKNNLSA